MMQPLRSKHLAIESQKTLNPCRKKRAIAPRMTQRAIAPSQISRTSPVRMAPMPISRIPKTGESLAEPIKPRFQSIATAAAIG
jgi:hypothetical protein